MRKVEQKILEALKKREMTAPEIAKEINSTLSYTYETLYRLELKKLVTRYWRGAWVWGLKKK